MWWSSSLHTSFTKAPQGIRYGYNYFQYMHNNPFPLRKMCLGDKHQTGMAIFIQLQQFGFSRLQVKYASLVSIYFKNLRKYMPWFSFLSMGVGTATSKKTNYFSTLSLLRYVCMWYKIKLLSISDHKLMKMQANSYSIHTVTVSNIFLLFTVQHQH